MLEKVTIEGIEIKLQIASMFFLVTTDMTNINASLSSIQFLYLVSIAITGLSPYVLPFKYKTRSPGRSLRQLSSRCFGNAFLETGRQIHFYIPRGARDTGTMSDSIAEKGGSSRQVNPWLSFFEKGGPTHTRERED